MTRTNVARNPNDVVAVGGLRTPMGNFGGTLRDMPAYDLGAVVAKAVLEKSRLSPNLIDAVLGGQTRQAGAGPNPVRTATRKAGLKAETPAGTMNNACPSSMKAAIQMAQSIMLGDVQVGLIIGQESMSTIPYLVKGIRWQGLRMGDHVLTDGWGDSVDPFCGFGMGVTAENVAAKYGISRQEQDQFAMESHQKAARAQDNGWFDNEISPVEVPSPKGKPSVIFSKDESIRRDTTLEKMAALKPAFKTDGSVTAGNSCGLTDGASAFILTSRKKAAELGVEPDWKLVSYATAAVDNATMGEGPAFSMPMALKRAGLSLSDMDVIEINEAFAAQVLCNERILKFDPSKLNLHGGAIALGHPTGCSGARIIVTGYNVLRRLDKEFLICGICGAGGITCATVIQREQ